jgi:hypothetical protein
MPVQSAWRCSCRGNTHGGMVLGLDRLAACANSGYVSGRYDVDGMTVREQRDRAVARLRATARAPLGADSDHAALASSTTWPPDVIGHSDTADSRISSIVGLPLRGGRKQLEEASGLTKTPLGLSDQVRSSEPSIAVSTSEGILTPRPLSSGRFYLKYRCAALMN